jgi:hypothetical protein
MSGKRKRKSETTISAAHEEKKPTCQEIDLSADNRTKDKNSSKDSDAIKFVNCTFCKDKIAAFKNYKDVINHTLLCNAPFVPVFRKYLHNKWVTNSGLTKKILVLRENLLEFLPSLNVWNVLI